jgi:hypothetical protein
MAHTQAEAMLCSLFKLRACNLKRAAIPSVLCRPV